MTVKRLRGYFVLVTVILVTYLVFIKNTSSVMFSAGLSLALVTWVFIEILINRAETRAEVAVEAHLMGILMMSNRQLTM